MKTVLQIIHFLLCLIIMVTLPCLELIIDFQNLACKSPTLVLFIIIGGIMLFLYSLSVVWIYTNKLHEYLEI